MTIYYFVDDTRTIIQNNVTPSARNRPGTLRLEKHKNHVTIRNPAMESMINQQNLLTSATNHRMKGMSSDYGIMKKLVASEVSAKLKPAVF